MAYYGQPIIEGLKGLGESIRGYGQTRMQTQLGLGQQQVDMAKMEYEAPLRQMETQMKYTEYQDWLKDQESKKQPVDFSSLMETARQSGDTNKLLRANKYINSLAGIWKLQREGDQLLKSDGTPLTEGDLDEEDVQKAAFAVGQIIKGPEKDTVEEHQKYIANARGYQGWLGQLPGINTKVFPTAFPEIETSQKRITELGKADKTVQKTIYKINDPTQTQSIPVTKGTTYAPPKGWSLAKPLTTKEKMPNELMLVAESIGVNLKQPITGEQAKLVIDELTRVKKERFKGTFIEALLSGNIQTIGLSSGLGAGEEDELKQRLNFRNK